MIHIPSFNLFMYRDVGAIPVRAQVWDGGNGTPAVAIDVGGSRLRRSAIGKAETWNTIRILRSTNKKSSRIRRSERTYVGGWRISRSSRLIARS